MAGEIKCGPWRVFERLGKGASGTVYRAVKEPPAGSGEEARVAEVLKCLRNAAGGADPAATEYTRKLLANLREILEQQQRPKIEGAIKLYVKREEDDLPADAQERVAREVKAMLTFANEPHALRLLDHELGKRPWIVTELHSGGSMDRPTLRGTFRGNFVGALRALRPIAALLAAIHKERHVHRDVAPKNIFMAADGRLILGDWGIVKRNNEGNTIVTMAGEVMGTKDMMPVWVRNKELKEWPANSDVYSWGKTLWMLIDGGIEPVPREYWKDDEYNLTRKFAGTTGIDRLEEVLSRTVVERPEACLKDGASLLELVNQVLRDIDGGFVRPGRFGGQTCRVCGEGKYIESDSPNRADRWHPIHQSRHLVQLGLEEQRWIIAAAACSACGHAEYFVWPPKGPAGLQDLTEGLSDQRLSVRACCAENLQAHQERSAARIAEALAVEPNLYVRRTLASLLAGAARNPRALEVLDKVAASDSDQDVRARAFQAAVEMRKRPE